MLDILNYTTKKLYDEFGIRSYVDQAENFQRECFYIYISIDDYHIGNINVDRRNVKLNIRYFPELNQYNKADFRKGVQVLDKLYHSFKNNKLVVDDRFISINKKEKTSNDDLFILSLHLEYFIDSPKNETGDYDLMKEIITRNI